MRRRCLCRDNRLSTISLGINPRRGGSPPRDNNRVIGIKKEDLLMDRSDGVCLREYILIR